MAPGYESPGERESEEESGPGRVEIQHESSAGAVRPQYDHRRTPAVEHPRRTAGPPPARPREPRHPGPYLPLDLPAAFVLEVRIETGAWIDWGAYDGDDFVRRDDGSYICEGEGSPTILRCIGYGPGHFLHVDQGGDGDVYVYRLVRLQHAED